MLAWALAAAKSAASESARIASDKYEECIIIWYVSRPPTRPDKQQQQDKMLRCHLSRRSKNKFVSSIFSRFWRVVRCLMFYILCAFFLDPSPSVSCAHVSLLRSFVFARFVPSFCVKGKIHLEKAHRTSQNPLN